MISSAGKYSRNPAGKERRQHHVSETTTEYDNTGNVTEKNEQIDSDREAKTEYTYDKRGNLVMVKSRMENEKAQYVQYVMTSKGTRCASSPE